MKGKLGFIGRSIMKLAAFPLHRYVWLVIGLFLGLVIGLVTGVQFDAYILRACNNDASILLCQLIEVSS
jgi:hypothetical protein